MENQILFSDFTGKRKWRIKFCFPISQENENGESNFVFRCQKKTENENGKSNFVFRCHIKTENENPRSISVFRFHWKTVGTKVHALQLMSLQ